MIGQYTLLLANGKIYTGLSLVICIVKRIFLLGTIAASEYLDIISENVDVSINIKY